MEFGLRTILIFTGFLFLVEATPVCALVQSQAQQEPTQQVIVRGDSAEHEEKSYQDMANAVSQFETYRTAHPEAKLRFRIYARKESADMAHLKVMVINEESQARWPIVLADDNSFTLPDIAESERKNARVRTNAKAGQLAWQVRVVRDEARPTRRILGDIREECRLEFNAAKIRRGVMPTALIALHGGGDVCTNKNLTFFDLGEEALFAVHLKFKDRQYSLLSDSLHDSGSPGIYHSLLDWTFALKDRTYRPPIWDTSWPDETEVNLIYVTDNAQRADQQ